MKSLYITRLRISEYFTDLIQQLDIHFEEILSTYKPNKSLEDELQQLRESYINEIRTVKELNINYYDKQQKFQAEKSTDLNETFENILKENCLYFCNFIYKKTYFKLVPLYKFGLLIVTDWFLSTGQLEIIENVFSNQDYIDYIGISYLPDVLKSRVLGDKYTLSLETINPFKILIMSLNMDNSKIIRIFRNSQDHIGFKEYYISSFEESIFDKSPITRLQDIYVDDIISLNNACLNDNYLFEELEMRYFYTLQENEASLNQLNLSRYKGLKKLHLVNGFIKNAKHRGSYLKNDFFNCLIKLEDLKIDDPTILGFHNDQFKHLECLKSLCINKIKLGYGKDRLFVDTSTIFNSIFRPIFSFLGYGQYKEDYSRSLNCRNNSNLNEIFNGLDNLEILNLSECYLCNDDLYFLNKLNNLKELNLSYNSIWTNGIADSSKLISFLKFENLTKLNLSNNKIKIVDQQFFQGMINLQNLDLSYIELDVICDYTFINLKQLKSLNLDGNTNEFLKEHSLHGLSSLEELFIQPTCMKIKSFKIFPNLKFLSIKSNCEQENIIRRNHDYLLINSKIDLFELLDGLDNLENLFFVNECFSVVYNQNFLQNMKNLKKLDLKLYLDKFENTHELLEDTFRGLDRTESLKLLIDPGLKILQSELLYKSLSNLEKLNLSHNSIGEIEDHAFDSLINLKDLRLNNNKLKEINGIKIFNKLEKLENLNLSFNQIKHISAGSFDNLTSLKYLYLQYNNLSRLDSNLLNNMPNLKVLCLHKQEISLRKENFDKLYNLTYLRINDLFTKIHSDIIVNLTGLHALLMENCIVEEITDQMFSSASNLRVLSIPSCRIRTIQKNAFMCLTELKELYLPFNEIRDLSCVTFENCVNLEHLDVRIDELEYFDFSILDKLKKLKRIEFVNSTSLKGDLIRMNKFKNKLFFEQSE